MINKLQIILYFLISFLIYSCYVDPNPCSLSEEVLFDIHSLDSIIKIPETLERDREWMKNNFNEPSIFDAENETFCFVLNSSFYGSEIYRVEKIGEEYKAVKKVFEYRDVIGVSKELQFSKDDWIYLTNELASNNFWTYPSSIDRRGLDGASWSLSGYKPKDECTLKNFHNVSRWSPIDTTFIAMCELFFELKEK